MIGKNITEIRKSRGYTLSELAELASISKSYLSNIERDVNKNPSIDVIRRIADVLHVDLKTLVMSGGDTADFLMLEKEWIDFLYELKELGIEKDEIKEYKTLIKFIKWNNENVSENN